MFLLIYGATAKHRTAVTDIGGTCRATVAGNATVAVFWLHESKVLFHGVSFLSGYVFDLLERAKGAHAEHPEHEFP